MSRTNGWRKSHYAGLFVLIFLIRIASAGVILDPTFDSGPGTELFVEHVIPLDDGKILMCGQFQWYNVERHPFITRLDETGKVDPTFKENVVSDWIRHMALQPDGKIVVGGAFTNAGGLSRNLIARLNTDGSIDPSFDPGSGFEEKVVPPDPNPPYVFWLTVQPDGKIIAVGSFAKYKGQTARGIARLNPDGSLDTSFKMGFGLDSWARFVMVQPNGQIIVTGWFTDYNGFSCNRMIRLNPDGTPDPTFKPYFGDKTAIYSAALLPDGKMLVSGHSKSDFGLFKREIARLNPDGTQDDTFLGHTNNRTESILLQPNGKFIVCGWFDFANTDYRGRIARFNADGSLDDTFHADAEFFVWNIAFDAKGRLLVVGGFPTIMGVKRSGIARLVDENAITPEPQGGAETLGISNVSIDSEAFEVQFHTATNRVYHLERRSDFSQGHWDHVTSVSGTGGLGTLKDTGDRYKQACYRIRAD